MAQFRQHFINRLSDALDKGPFSASDFTISYPADELFNIEFKLDPTYRFRVVYRKERNGQLVGLTIHDAPGDEYLLQQSACADLDDAVKAVTPWTVRIKEELKALRPTTDIEELRRDLEESIEAHKNETGYFTEDEVDTLKAKIVAMAMRIDELASEHENHRAEFEALKAKVEVAAESIDTLPKNVWYRSMAGAIVKGAKAFTTKEGRKIAAEVTKKLVLNGFGLED